jgi:hypothetical protein
MNGNPRHEGRGSVVQDGSDLDNPPSRIETAPVAKHHAEPDLSPSPLAIFQLRAWARAYLWACCLLSLHEAVDELQSAAEQSELIEQIGVDRVQEILAQEFESAANV